MSVPRTDAAKGPAVLCGAEQVSRCSLQVSPFQPDVESLVKGVSYGVKAHTFPCPPDLCLGSVHPGPHAAYHMTLPGPKEHLAQRVSPGAG